MTIRPVNLATDYPMLQAWWEAHRFPVIPSFVFLPALGFIVESESTALAASWLFVCSGTQGGIGLVQFTTTNPTAESRSVLEGIKELYHKLEQAAMDHDCGSILGLTAPNSGLQHVMDKMGYTDIGNGNHLIYGKALWQ